MRLSGARVAHECRVARQGRHARLDHRPHERWRQAIHRRSKGQTNPNLYPRSCLSRSGLYLGANREACLRFDRQVRPDRSVNEKSFRCRASISNVREGRSDGWPQNNCPPQLRVCGRYWGRSFYIPCLTLLYLRSGRNTINGVVKQCVRGRRVGPTTIDTDSSGVMRVLCRFVAQTGRSKHVF